MKTIEQSSVISEKDKTLLHKIKEIVLGFLPTAEILLYGSVARGTQGPESDYDMLILTDDPLSYGDSKPIESEMLSLELSEDVILSTIYHTKEEWASHAALPLHAEVKKHGIVL